MTALGVAGQKILRREYYDKYVVTYRSELRIQSNAGIGGWGIYGVRLTCMQLESPERV